MYSRELTFASELVRQVGQLMVKNLQVGRTHRLKTDGSSLTDIDTEINQHVITAIQARFPKDSILGEEQSALMQGAVRTWILDPIDGTFPFTCGVPTSVVMLALIENNTPQLGIIYNPYVEQLFSAVRGHGAFLDDRHGRHKLTVDSSFIELRSAPIGITGSISGTVLDVPAVRASVEKQFGRPQILGATGYESAMVASGQYGGQIFGYDTRHDMAAADVIIKEAGGMVTDVFGKPLDYSRPLDGGISSNSVLHDSLLELVQPYILKKV